LIAGHAVGNLASKDDVERLELKRAETKVAFWNLMVVEAMATQTFIDSV